MQTIHSRPVRLTVPRMRCKIPSSAPKTMAIADKAVAFSRRRSAYVSGLSIAVLVEIARAEGVVRGDRLQVRVERERAAGEQLVRRALDEAADDVAPVSSCIRWNVAISL
jgi:hypothetical protein